MKENFSIQIKEPCNVGRENMKTIPGGSFCNLCSKKVHDLTDKTDEEIKLLLQTNESVCGRIQPSRLHSSEEKSKTSYNFFRFPFRKVASRIFIAAMFTSSLYAQTKKIDTLDIDEVTIDGMIVYTSRSDEDDRKPYYSPKTLDFQIEYSGNKELLEMYNRVSILTLNKRYGTTYVNNFLRIPENYLGVKNILVFENGVNRDTDLNKNQFYTFTGKKERKDGKTIVVNLDKVKKAEFALKNEEVLYFLDGTEISKEEFEKNRSNKKIESYFLPEIYAQELLGDHYDYEDGIILSYTD